MPDSVRGRWSMTKQPRKSLVCAMCCGLALGLIISSPFWSMTINNMLCQMRSLEVLWEWLLYPAIAIAHLWTYFLRLPPGGELGAWLIVPCIAVFVQWFVLGFLLCLWYLTRRRLRGSVRSEPCVKHVVAVGRDETPRSIEEVDNRPR